MNYTHILTDFMIKQFDVKKLEEIVKAFLELVETATLILDDKDYYIRITPPIIKSSVFYKKFNFIFLLFILKFKLY